MIHKIRTLSKSVKTLKIGTEVNNIFLQSYIPHFLEQKEGLCEFTEVVKSTH